MRGICGCTFLLLLLASGASARVWYVKPDSTGVAPSIQAGIDSCASGDTVLVSPGTYTGAGNRDIDFNGKAIVVMSLSGAKATIIDCGGSADKYHRGFYFHSGEDTTSVLQGFTIKNGYSSAGAGILCSFSSPRICQNTLSDNYSRNAGGGILSANTHSIISRNIFSNNEVEGRYVSTQESAIGNRPVPGGAARYKFAGGGGICCLGDSSLIESNFLTRNVGSLGTAISCEGSVVIRYNTVYENYSSWGGEGTVWCGEGTFLIERNRIVDNRTLSRAGGIYCSGGNYTIVGNTISHNSAGFTQIYSVGGGLYCGEGSYTIADNEIEHNEASAGAGLAFYGSGSIQNNTISNNASTGYENGGNGGGIALSASGPLVVAGNSITHNAALCGGGIICSGTNNAEITDNVISHNNAFYDSYMNKGGMGGGIYCIGSSPTIARNTIYSNSATKGNGGGAAGGGIFCTSGSSPAIFQNIVAENEVENGHGAGGIYCADSTSAPLISCCDVIGNSNANYGGTLADQTGLNGNFALDPVFCDAAGGDYHIHMLSPCMPGNHPHGMDCGPIGALGGACDFAITLIRRYSTEAAPFAVTITWTLAREGNDPSYTVLRGETPDGEYREIQDPCITRKELTFTFRDAGCDPGTAYRYRVNVLDDRGERVLFETAQIVTPALPLSLYQNFPNPFNPSTVITYYLPHDAPVVLAVYDISGRRVVDLIGRAEKKGRHSVTWNGKDEAGGSVASGVYFYRLTDGKETVSKKMILLR